jgi:hypothetical protein
MKIEQMRGNNGPVKNQFVIWADDGCYFQSYKTIIAFRPLNGEPIQLDSNNWDYSKTTGKYRNLFLRETKADTERKIKEGKYILTDLNK